MHRTINEVQGCKSLVVLFCGHAMSAPVGRRRSTRVLVFSLILVSRAPVRWRCGRQSLGGVVIENLPWRTKQEPKSVDGHGCAERHSDGGYYRGDDSRDLCPPSSFQKSVTRDKRRYSQNDVD